MTDTEAVHQCPICDTQRDSEAPRRGRPTIYCGRTCRDLSAFLTQVEQLIGQVTPATPEATARLRSWFWKSANLLNRGGSRKRSILPACCSCGRRRRALAEGLCSACILEEWRSMRGERNAVS